MPARSLHTHTAPHHLPVDYLGPLYGHCRGPTQSGLMSTRKLISLIRAGYGQGHLDRYKPWLRVEKRDYSPVSSMGHLPSKEFGHTHHYRSRLERGMLLVLHWLGAYDARDQYPVWPWPHWHPLWGLPGQDDIGVVDGFSAHANQAGIPVRFSIRRWIPTVDILSTWENTDGSFRLVVHDGKPSALMQGPSAWTTLERMEVVRRYAHGIGAAYHHVSDFSEHPGLIVNLHALLPNFSRHVRRRARSSNDYRCVVETCARWAYADPLQVAIERVAKKINQTTQAIQKLVDLAVWHQDLDHDIRMPLESWSPLEPGGQALRSRLLVEWGGRDHGR